MCLTGFGANSSVCAQSPSQSIRGIVRDASGARIAGATLHAVHRPIGSILDSGPTSHVSVVSDTRGRFKLPARRGYTYSLWASKDDGEGYRTSQILDRAQARSVVRLELTEKTRKRIRINIDGLAKWKHRGPLQFFCLDPAPRVMLRTASKVDARGQATLPRISSNGCWVEIDDAKGIPIFQALLVPQNDKPGQRLEIGVAPPRKLRVRATKREKGNKIGEGIKGGATVYFGRNPSRHPLTRVGEVDGDGILELELAISEKTVDSPGVRRCNSLDDTVLVVSGEDYADAYANLTRTGGKRVSAGMYEVAFGLQQGFTVTGRVMRDAKRPLANAVLMHYAGLFGKTGGGQVACTPRRVECDADGRFKIRGQNSKYPFRLVWMPSDEDRAALSSPDHPLGAEHLLAAMKLDIGGTQRKLGEIRIDKLVRIDLEARAADETPIEDALYQIYDDRISKQGTNRPMTLRGNRRSAVRFLCPKQAKIAVWMASSTGFAETELDAHESPASSHRVTLRFDTTRRMSGQISDLGSGKAIPFARVMLASLNNAGRGSRSRLRTARSLGGMNRDPLPPLHIVERNQIRRRVWGAFGPAEEEIRCDANGRFEIFLPAKHSGMSLISYATAAQKWKRGMRIDKVEPDSNR